MQHLPTLITRIWHNFMAQFPLQGVLVIPFIVQIFVIVSVTGWLSLCY